jgi:CBS-domain-containing membrane protein
LQVDADDNLLKVFEMFAASKTLHRIPVMDAAEEWARTIVKIITQSGIARFIKENEVRRCRCAQ